VGVTSGVGVGVTSPVTIRIFPLPLAAEARCPLRQNAKSNATQKNAEARSGRAWNLPGAALVKVPLIRSAADASNMTIFLLVWFLGVNKPEIEPENGATMIPDYGNYKTFLIKHV
jgi:hypothetical protein